MEDELATDIGTLPGGPMVTVAGTPDRQPDPNNQAAVHDIMQEMEARRMANPNAPPQMGNAPQMPIRGPEDLQDPYYNPNPQHFHSQSTVDKTGYLGMLTSMLKENSKEPALVAAISFLVHQEFFSRIVLSILPSVLRRFAEPGSSSMVPSIIKAVIVGVLYMFLRRMF